MIPKDKKIIEDAERIGIPIFVLTAKDLLTVDTLDYYLLHCEAAKCNPKHIQGVKDRIKEFESFQNKSSHLTHFPD